MSTSYGVSSLKVHGQLFACPAINKSAEPNSLMIRCDLDQRAGLLAEDPATYYLTDHYEPYPCVLVRLSQVRLDVLKDLIRMSWQFVSSKARAKRPAQRRPAALTSKKSTKRGG